MLEALKLIAIEILKGISTPIISKIKKLIKGGKK